MALLHVVFTGLRHSALRRNKVVLKTDLQLFLEQSHCCVLGIIFFGDFANILVVAAKPDLGWRLSINFFLDNLW